MNSGKKDIRNTFLVTVLCLIALFGNAQSNLIFYTVNNQFNAPTLNPAFLTSQKEITFSIFPVGGMSIGFNNQKVINDLASQFIAGTQTTENFRKVFNSLVKKDLFLMQFESSLLNLGYNSNIGSFNFHIREHFELLTDFKGDLSGFFVNPDSKSLKIGQPQLFKADAIHFREYSLGYAKEIIKDKLTFGIRAKVYFGKSALSSEVSGVVVEKPDSFYIQVNGPMKLSVPANPIDEGGYISDLNIADNFNVGKYITNNKNLGTGLDLGFKFVINPQAIFSASVVDLGRINWKNNINSLIYNDEFAFSKQNILSTKDENGATILTKTVEKPLQDSITFKLTLEQTAFSKPVPTNFYVGLQYQFKPNFNLGIVDRFTMVKDMNYNSFSLTAAFNVNPKLTLITGYSVYGKVYNNIPFALFYEWDKGQSYLSFDNVLSTIVPSFSEYSGISFGTCFYLFTKRKLTSDPTDYLPFYKRRKIKKKNSGLILRERIRT